MGDPMKNHIVSSVGTSSASLRCGGWPTHTRVSASMRRQIHARRLDQHDHGSTSVWPTCSRAASRAGPRRAHRAAFFRHDRAPRRRESAYRVTMRDHRYLSLHVLAGEYPAKRRPRQRLWRRVRARAATHSRRRGLRSHSQSTLSVNDTDFWQKNAINRPRGSDNERGNTWFHVAEFRPVRCKPLAKSPLAG